MTGGSISLDAEHNGALYGSGVSAAQVLFGRFGVKFLLCICQQPLKACSTTDSLAVRFVFHSTSISISTI